MSNRLKPILIVTDTNDVPLKELDLGSIAMSGETFKFRVWNNLGGYSSKAVANGISIEIKATPTRKHTVLLSNDFIKGRATFSAKTKTIVTENFYPMPLESDEYNYIPPGFYNEYEIQVDAQGISDYHKNLINNKELTFHLVVRRVGVSYLASISIIKFSDTRIKNTLVNSMTSATRIILTREIMDILSDTRVLFPTQIQSLSDTRILNPSDITITSDMKLDAVLEIPIISTMRMFLADNEITKLSSSRVMVPGELIELSDSRIKKAISINTLMTMRVLKSEEIPLTSTMRVA